MSNQIIITSGAKVRSLEGVLTGTAGVVSSVPYGGANGVATLDGSGKVPLSQLPASVITYLGTWNASTNTPTLVNGTGDTGDLYICNVAGTVNFGAGPITFAVGDWVIYSGTTWEKSGGASGTVTSVAMTTPTGLSVSGSPITTSGTLALSLSSGYTIPTTSFLQGLVPYTGATTDLNLGSHKIIAEEAEIGQTLSVGSASAGSTGDIAASGDIYGNSFIKDGGTSSQYLMADGSVSTGPDLTGYVPYTGATATLDLGLFPLQSFGVNIAGGSGLGGAVNIRQATSHSLWTGGNYTSIYADTSYGLKFYFANDGRTFTLSASAISAGSPPTYTMPASSGTLALTSDIPSLTNYVTLNTLQTITGVKFFNAEASFDSNIVLTGGDFVIGNSGYDTSINTETLTASRSINFPDASGVVALTSQLTNGTVTSVTVGTGEAGTNVSANVATSTTTPVITINIPIASSTNTGKLSSTDWTTFNNKQNALTNPVTGTGTSGYLPKMTGSTTLGDSIIYQTTTNYVGINTTNPGGTLPGGAGWTSQPSKVRLLQINATDGNANAGLFLRQTDNSTGLDLWADNYYGDSYIDSRWNDANGRIYFRLRTNGTPVDAMTLTAGGNLGIGTISPSSRLSLEKAKSGSGVESLDMLSLRLTGTTAIGDALNINFYNGTNTNIARISSLLGADNVAYGTLTFSTRNYNTDSLVEVMRLNNRGYLKASNNGTYINGATSTFHSLEQSGTTDVALYAYNSYAGNGNVILARGYSNNTSGSLFLGYSSSIGDYTIRIFSNGNIQNQNNSYGSLSDIKLKENIVDTTSKLEDLLKVRIVNYNLKGKEQKQIGVIAQELEQIFPSMIDEIADTDEMGNDLGTTTKSVKYSVFVPMLIKAIQELSAKVSALENKS